MATLPPAGGRYLRKLSYSMPRGAATRDVGRQQQPSRDLQPESAGLIFKVPDMALLRQALLQQYKTRLTFWRAELERADPADAVKADRLRDLIAECQHQIDHVLWQTQAR
jgi:hypothetical protein